MPSESGRAVVLMILCCAKHRIPSARDPPAGFCFGRGIRRGHKAGMTAASHTRSRHEQPDRRAGASRSLPSKDTGRGVSPPRRAQAGACSPRSRTKTRNRAAPYLVRWAAAAVTDCSCHSPRRQQLKNTVTRCRGCECEVAHTSLPFSPSKVCHSETSIWRQEGYMAPKPKPARFVFTVGMVLAMAQYQTA